MSNPGDNLSEFSMIELFRLEVETQKVLLNNGLVNLERDPTNQAELEILMRAAHSLKGAARIVGLDVAVRVAHVMEDGFVAAQKGSVVLGQRQIDVMLRGVDLLWRIASTSEADVPSWSADKAPEIEGFLDALKDSLAGKSAPVPAATKPQSEAPVKSIEKADEISAPTTKATQERFLRVTSGNLNRLLGLASESLVESRRLRPFAETMLRLKRHHHDLSRMLELLQASMSSVDELTQNRLTSAQEKVAECRYFLTERLGELDMFDRRATTLSKRLYAETLSCRMRPFADGVQGFPRLVRDLSRKLNKDVRLEILGQETQVDREILEQLETPITHILGNAIDHGFESSDERSRLGKSPEGTLRLEARHSAGVLLIIVSDDGRGIDVEAIKRAVVRKKLATADVAERMSEMELMEFLFLPGFSMKESVTDISGRGVGLDIVRNMARNVRGTVRVSSQLGRGTRFQFELPLTLSVVRSLLINIGGEPYALPLASVNRTLKLRRDTIQTLEGKQHFPFDGRQIGLVTAHQVLESDVPPPADGDMSVIIFGERERLYGLVVDKFLGEQELVVQPLDPRLGKIRDISSGALMENGSPVLILDADDLIRSIEKLASGGLLSKVHHEGANVVTTKQKRVLVVDDSLTVRELERKLLEKEGYEVEIAVDGMDGWNAVRTSQFDLVVSDVDMPRMDGIELLKNIRADAKLKSLPVMIVTYKDREEDRQRGLEAGADYYLAKGSFHDAMLTNAVVDLIGKADA
ncbi:MAG: chemotaxis protein CheA [Verrucomicrobiales bacterium]|nr:chemotaxis protein CheA [Verrucomicrobiales bacterium]